MNFSICFFQLGCCGAGKPWFRTRDPWILGQAASSGWRDLEACQIQPGCCVRFACKHIKNSLQRGSFGLILRLSAPSMAVVEPTALAKAWEEVPELRRAVQKHQLAGASLLQVA